MEATTPAGIQKARHRVAAVSELPPGQRKIIAVGKREVGVFNVNGTFRAVLNVCPHELAPVCKGHVRGTTQASEPGKKFKWGNEGEILLCPWHGWEFNLHDGKSLHDDACHLKTYEIVVEEGVVYVVA
jgi:nitrite reductase (NADH) small subunit